MKPAPDRPSDSFLPAAVVVALIQISVAFAFASFAIYQGAQRAQLDLATLVAMLSFAIAWGTILSRPWGFWLHCGIVLLLGLMYYNGIFLIENRPPLGGALTFSIASMIQLIGIKNYYGAALVLGLTELFSLTICFFVWRHSKKFGFERKYVWDELMVAELIGLALMMAAITYGDIYHPKTINDAIAFKKQQAQQAIQAKIAADKESQRVYAEWRAKTQTPEYQAEQARLREEARQAEESRRRAVNDMLKKQMEDYNKQSGSGPPPEMKELLQRFDPESQRQRAEEKNKQEEAAQTTNEKLPPLEKFILDGQDITREDAKATLKKFDKVKLELLAKRSDFPEGFVGWHIRLFTRGPNPEMIQTRGCNVMRNQRQLKIEAEILVPRDPVEAELRIYYETKLLVVRAIDVIAEK